MTRDVMTWPEDRRTVDQLGVTQPIAPATAREHVGRVRHALGATRHDDVGLAEQDLVRRVDDGAQP